MKVPVPVHSKKFSTETIKSEQQWSIDARMKYRLTAWLPKIIVLLGLFLACSVVLLLPFDASMSQSCQQDPNCPATQGLAQLWYQSYE